MTARLRLWFWLRMMDALAGKHFGGRLYAWVAGKAMNAAGGEDIRLEWMCGACGRKYRMRLPQSHRFIKQSAYRFIEEHSKCKPATS